MNDLTIPDATLARIRHLAEHWGVSPQAALAAAVEDTLDDVHRDPEYWPDALFGGDATPASFGPEPGWKTLWDLPEFQKMHAEMIAFEREHPESVPYFEDELSLTAPIARSVHELAALWGCRWPQTALRIAVDSALAAAKRMRPEAGTGASR
ncbi:hypothetical protein [Solimonas flava]|uniref:hypothetical protein n=1 Tax=Solimonas flava TaxID=415849 RepID=UPI0004298286|nr:hypothetical protein [Solimonas flava]